MIAWIGHSRDPGAAAARPWVFYALGLADTPSARSFLEGALEDPALRVSAAIALAAEKDAALYYRLPTRALGDHPMLSGVRPGPIRNARALRTMVDLFFDPSVEAADRTLLVRIVSPSIDDDTAAGSLRRLATTDPDPDVRAAGLIAFAARQDAPTQPWLREVAVASTHAPVRLAAIMAMSRADAENQAFLAARYWETTDIDGRSAILTKLDELTSVPSAHRLLCDVLEREPQPALRRAAALALAVGSSSLADPGSARKVLHRALDDADPDVRLNALHALESLGDRETIELLEQRIRTGSPPAAETRRAVERLKAKQP